jgi:hypothetical protein
MNRACWIGVAVIGLLGGVFQGAAATYPDGYPVVAGPDFQALDSSHPDRPEWLFATARGVARSVDGSREWATYEFVLDRANPFRHLLVELLLAEKPGELFIRLLDGNRQALTADLFGNIAERAEAPGNVFLDISLAEWPAAAVVQLLVPLAEESTLKQMVLTPASYEILLKTAGDFVSGASAWIRTPVLDSKHIGLLSDLVLLEEGRSGDMSSPVSAFRAYGVDSRKLDVEGAAATSRGGTAPVATGFALDAMPLLARFDVALRNFDPLAPIELWLNGQKQGGLSLDLPDLEDSAYWPPEKQTVWRVGRWTRAWFYIPPEALRMGDNTLELRPTSARADAAELEIRDAGLQFKYPWEEIGTYSFAIARRSTRNEPIAGGISHAPVGTTRQEPDTVIIRVDHDQFQPIGPESEKPDWLVSVDREFPAAGSPERQYRIRLNPDNRPAQLGMDIVCLSGMRAPVRVSLLSGTAMVASNLLETTLNSGYVQMTTTLLVPLQDHPAADTVLLFVGPSMPGQGPALSRLQLKAAWPAPVLASGQLGTEGAVIDMQYDSRSAFIPAEVVVPDEGGASATVQHIPPAVEGEWYGAETRILQDREVPHGDSRDIYFTDWTVAVDEVPLLGRVDLLVMHLSVVDGMEVFVNGAKAGVVSLHLPGVQDANYMVFHVNRIAKDGLSLTKDEKYAIDYGAYARASLVFDGSLLRPGKNTISIGRTPRLKGTNDHYTFKKIRLQLKYAQK